MIITIRWTSGKTYAVVTVEDGSAAIYLGYLNAVERSTLAAHLREAAEELHSQDMKDELIGALQDCLEHMAYSTTQGGDAWDRARAAIAKARGEA